MKKRLVRKLAKRYTQFFNSDRPKFKDKQKVEIEKFLCALVDPKTGMMKVHW